MPAGVDVRAGEGEAAYRVGFADVAEFVDVYTRQLLSGALFLPLERLEGRVAGQACRLRVELPEGAEVFGAEGTIEAVSQRAPRGLHLRVHPLDEALRTAIEAYLTEVLRGEAPTTRLPEPATERPQPAVDLGGDAALAFQEEATGRAVDGRSMHVQLREMSHQERIRLALTGGKAARAALIRSPQPVYHPYVVQNPRITRQELAAITKNPNVAPDALRLIATSAQHMSDPAIRMNVVKNPKTDPQLAQRFLPRLAQAQLRQLARSDDVRANLKSAAVRLLSRSSR